MTTSQKKNEEILAEFLNEAGIDVYIEGHIQVLLQAILEAKDKERDEAAQKAREEGREAGANRESQKKFFLADKLCEHFGVSKSRKLDDDVADEVIKNHKEQIREAREDSMAKCESIIKSEMALEVENSYTESSISQMKMQSILGKIRSLKTTK